MNPSVKRLYSLLLSISIPQLMLSRMKLHLTNAEVGMWNAEGWSRFAQSFFLK